MKIDPNRDVNVYPEYILCENGYVLLHDGASVSQAEIDDGQNAFAAFCKSLDPNACFLVALLPDDADKAVFFKARQVASDFGIHMQSPLDTPEWHRQQWESYKQMKRYRSVADEASENGEGFE